MSNNANRTVDTSELLGALPEGWFDTNLVNEIYEKYGLVLPCFVVLDDDAAGPQTISDAVVLATWEPNVIQSVFEKNVRVFFVLTNSRAYPPETARRIYQEAATNVMRAALAANRDFIFVSRADSTLRGHYPQDVDSILDVLKKGGFQNIDAVCLVPSFIEGKRFTINDTQWLEDNGKMIPVSLTAYAKDKHFAFRNAKIPLWIEEKTEGRIRPTDIVSVSIEKIRTGGPLAVAEILMATKDEETVIVNAVTYSDLDVFVAGLCVAYRNKKRLIFRVSASFIKALYGPNTSSAQQILFQKTVTRERTTGGLVVVGSYVARSNGQLTELLDLERIVASEADVRLLLSEPAMLIEMERLAALGNKALHDGNDFVIFTTRELVTNTNEYDDWLIGLKISLALATLVKLITVTPHFLLSKGGTTSGFLLTEGLNIQEIRIAGQVMPGVPVCFLPFNSKWPKMPFVIFPGNVGEKDSLAKVVEALRLNY